MGIGPQDGLQHLLVLQAASAETRQWLTAAADGGLGKRSRTRDVSVLVSDELLGK